jgi:AmmeMemoRadiSam system protein A/AmmeMemoRadiSam system protein B
MLASGIAVLLPAAWAWPAGVTTRPAVCVGTWYSDDPQTLRRQISGWMDAGAARSIPGKPIAIIAPHAGYRFSGPVAAAAARCLRGQTYRRVFVLAFSHRAAGRYSGIQVPTDYDAYAAGLGPVPIDLEAVARLRKSPVFVTMAGIDRDEHSLELQLPILQEAVGRFELVPLLVGRMSPARHTLAARAIVPLVVDDTLLVASSDFTHFGPNYGYEPFQSDVPARLSELAEQAALPLLNCDFDSFADHVTSTHDTICGQEPILLLMRILSMRGGAAGTRAALDFSGRLTNDWTNSVTYQSFVYTPRPGTLDEATRRGMLDLARRTVAAALGGQAPPRPAPETLTPAARAPGACFVTLQNRGELRGCIGNMTAQGPLYEAVIHNAIAAATGDYRFADNPVTPAELPAIHIEISFLTPFKPVARPQEIIVGRHGLLIDAAGQRGVLLPQVAYERGWQREEFLAQVCHKAGLAPDAWKRPEARLYSFEAEVFGEPGPPSATAPAGRPSSRE